MNGFSMDANAKCPFYRRCERQTIVCEGMVERSAIHLTYCNARDLERQQEVFCCREYEKCEIYAAILRAKYDG